MPTQDRPFRIFVSSTHDDLVDHRAAATEAIRGLDLADRAMETFAAEPGTPVDVCRAKVRDCDALVVLLAHRYGWVPSADQGGDGRRSITWIEVDEAEANGIPVFAFLVDRAAPWTGPREQDAIGPDSPLEALQQVQRNLRGLAELRAHLEAHVTRATFHTPADVRNEVTRSLARWIVEKSRRPAAPAPAGPPGPPPDTRLRAYLAEVEHEHGSIRLQGIYSRTGAGRRALAFPIEAIYTPLTTRAPELVGAEGLGMRIATRNRVPLTDLLSRARRLLVIGQPGGGKTTFLRLIATLLARDGLRGADPQYEPQRVRHLGLPAAAPAPVPILVRLAALAGQMRAAGAQHPGDRGSHRWLLRALPEEARDVLEGLLDEGRCALLLDGLDEVAEDDARERIVAVVDAVLHRWDRNLVVVTSRPYGFEGVAALKGVERVHVDDFDDDDIRAFLARWVAGLDAAELAGDERTGTAELERAIVDVPHIRRMARNPVMLTSLCVIHWNEKRLPEGKADLLAAVLRWLLNAHEPNRKERGFTNRFAERCFRDLAWAMMAGDRGRLATADLCWAAEQLAGAFRDERGIEDLDAVRREGMAFLEGEMLWSGIVEKVGEGQLRFWHLTFQEHYAARALVDRSDKAWWAAVKDRLWDRGWCEVVDHLAGCLAWTGESRLNRLVERILALATAGDLAATARVVGVLGRLLRILHVYEYAPPPHLGWEVVRARVMDIFTIEGARRVPWRERIAAAEALGDDDPRFRGLVEPATAPVPGHEGVELGLYPVTVREYRRFVENEGYRDAPLWGEDWTLKQRMEWTEPERWEAQQATPNRPVVGVSWQEAVAFCRWLSAATRPGWRLPTEAEWLAAAHHPDREYPWGNAKPDEERANYGNNVGGPTPVGIYPAGAGPAGHLDLAGNVWEWCAREDTDEWRDCRTLRGGGWWQDAAHLRSAAPDTPATMYHSGFAAGGFRVALSPPSMGTRST